MLGVDVLLLALLLPLLVLGGLLLVPLGVLLAPVLQEVEQAERAERDAADDDACGQLLPLGLEAWVEEIGR